MDALRRILQEVAKGRLSVEQAERDLEAAGTVSGYVDIGHTKVDVDRHRRRGLAEVVYCSNKTAEQVLSICERLDAAGQNVLCTRVEPAMAAEILASRPDFTYHPEARILLKRNEKPRRPGGLILVISAGTSDIPVAEEAALCAEMMGNRVGRVFDVGVAGLHRLFGAAGELMPKARCIIVVAGMEGALPSVVAGLVSAPVIAVPTSVGYGASFGGVAALLGMLNSCSGGIAVVNIDNGFGAGFMAHLINQVGERKPPPRRR